MSAVLFTLGCVFLLIAMHPFTTYPLSLWLVRFAHRRPIRDVPGPKPSFGVCVCAYNEERVIEQKVRNLLEIAKDIPDLQILFYVDASSDRTAEILKAYEPRITVHVSPERHGKTHGMKLLVDMCTADIAVFSDANVMLNKQALQQLTRYFADPDIALVMGHLIYTNGESTETAEVGSLYWRYEEWLKQLESDTGSAVGADGSLFAMRRVLYRKPPDNLIDDFYVSLVALCEGGRVVRAGDVLAYEQTSVTFADEYKRKVRIACQAFNVHRVLWPRLSQLDGLHVYKYVSHRLLRWVCVWNLLIAGLFIEAGLIVAGAYWVALALPLVAIGGPIAGKALGIPGLKQLFEIGGAFLATGVGVLRSLRGEQFQTWTPVNSVRDAPADV